MESGRDNPSYFLSDGDKARQKPAAGSYNFSRDPERRGGVARWMRQNQIKLAVTTCISFVLFLILFIVLYFSLRSVAVKKKPHCHKFFEAEIITVDFECRLWRIFKIVSQSDQIKNNNQVQVNRRCNCTPLSTFWQWWNKNFSHLNNVLNKFELVGERECNLRDLQNIKNNLSHFKDSNICSTVVLTMKVKNRLRELAFLISNAGFIMVLNDKDKDELTFQRPMGNFQNENIDDVIFHKINNFFRHVDNCVGVLKMSYKKTLDYEKQLTISGDAYRAEKSFFLYSENKYCVVLPELVNDEKIAYDLSQASMQLGIFAGIPNDNLNEISLETNDYNVGVHDGEQQENIAHYYQEFLRNETLKKETIVIKALRKLSLNNEADISYETCLKLRMGECSPSENWEEFVVTVYNPSDHPRNIFVMFPVHLNKYSVRTFEGENLPIQTTKLATSIINSKLKKLESEHRIYFSASWALSFRAEDVPGYGFKSYYVSNIDSSQFHIEKQQPRVHFTLNILTHKLAGVIINGKQLFLETNLALYDSSYCGGTLSRFKIIEKGQGFGSPIKKGDILTEYEYVYEGLGYKIIRTYADEDYLEVEWIFQNLTFFGEIAIQYNTTIDNQGVFYTGGHEDELELKRNHRTSCSKNCLVQENCTVKYYPTEGILIKDSSTQMYVLSETPQSVTSPCSGIIEFSILLKPKNDSFMSQKHWIFFGKSGDESFQRKIQHFALKNKVEPLLFFSNPGNFLQPFENWRDRFVTQYSSLSPDISKNIFIVTFERKKENMVWMRLKNAGDYPAKITFKNMFPKFEVEAKEINFGGPLCSSDTITQHQFLCNKNFDFQLANGLPTTETYLLPFEIRSFLLVMKPKQLNFLS